jgi:hypothetical protein
VENSNPNLQPPLGRLSSLEHIVRLASTLCGIVSPISLAVFKLIISSKFVGLLDRKIGRLGSFEDLVHVIRYAPVVREIRAVIHEPASIYSVSVGIHRR